MIHNGKGNGFKRDYEWLLCFPLTVPRLYPYVQTRRQRYTAKERRNRFCDRARLAIITD